MEEDKRIEVQAVPMYEELPVVLQRSAVCREPVFSEDRKLKIRFFLFLVLEVESKAPHIRQALHH